jgi:hypothetical protein
MQKLHLLLQDYLPIIFSGGILWNYLSNSGFRSWYYYLSSVKANIENLERWIQQQGR